MARARRRSGANRASRCAALPSLCHHPTSCRRHTCGVTRLTVPGPHRLRACRSGTGTAGLFRLGRGWSGSCCHGQSAPGSFAPCGWPARSRPPSRACGRASGRAGPVPDLPEPSDILVARRSGPSRRWRASRTTCRGATRRWRASRTTCRSAVTPMACVPHDAPRRSSPRRYRLPAFGIRPRLSFPPVSEVFEGLGSGLLANR